MSQTRTSLPSTCLRSIRDQFSHTPSFCQSFRMFSNPYKSMYVVQLYLFLEFYMPGGDAKQIDENTACRQMRKNIFDMFISSCCTAYLYCTRTCCTAYLYCTRTMEAALHNGDGNTNFAIVIATTVVVVTVGAKYCAFDLG